MLKKLWNLPEEGIIGATLGIIKPWTKVSRDLYISRPGLDTVKCRLIYGKSLPFAIPRELSRHTKNTTKPTPVAPPLSNSPIKSSSPSASTSEAETNLLPPLKNQAEVHDRSTNDSNSFSDGEVPTPHSYKKFAVDASDPRLKYMEDESGGHRQRSPSANHGFFRFHHRRPPSLHNKVELIPTSDEFQRNGLSKGTRNGSDVPVMLHFHGGGFISGSAGSHEVYLRTWANQTPFLIISVDYRLAPEARYPYQLNECYDVYRWIISENPLGIKPSVLVLSGDSAGGNLALAVTLKAISDGARIPDGLLLAYPAIDLTQAVTSSRFLFHNDFIVPHHFLQLCREAYIPLKGDLKDPFLSPLYAPDDMLKKLPSELYIMSSGIDPLLDDTTRFLYRLKELGLSVSYKRYDFLPHGFWNFGSLLPTAYESVKECSVILNQILDRVTKNNTAKQGPVLGNSPGMKIDDKMTFDINGQKTS